MCVCERERERGRQTEAPNPNLRKRHEYIHVFPFQCVFADSNLNIISLFGIWRRILKLPEFLLAALQFALQIGTNQFSADFTRSKQYEGVLARDYPQPRG
jgi:hypothetical protein